MAFDDSLNGYARELDRAPKKGDEFANYNKDMVHATIVVCTAFRYAKQRIRLLSQKLDPALYAGPWFMEEINGFLERKGELNVLVETDVEPSHELMKLAKENPNQISVRRVPESLLDRYLFNFMVVDDIGYRLEHDRKEPAAVFAFNSENKLHVENTEMLTEWFDELSEISEPIALGFVA